MLCTHGWVDPYPSIIVGVLCAVCSEHWREDAPLDPPCVELGGWGCEVTPDVVAPEPKPHIRGGDGECDLVVERSPALWWSNNEL